MVTGNGYFRISHSNEIYEIQYEVNNDETLNGEMGE